MNYLRITVVLAALAAVFVLAPPAEGRFIQPKKPLDEMPLTRQLSFLKFSRNYYSYICHRSRDFNTRLSHCDAWRWARGELTEVKEILYPPPPPEPPLPPHVAAWNCIHHYEGSWTDDGAPYWGGLQMDMSFMQAYGAELLRTKGTANHWTPLEQMWVAERAYRSGRGFYPWPNTARYCGLI